MFYKIAKSMVKIGDGTIFLYKKKLNYSFFWNRRTRVIDDFCIL